MLYRFARECVLSSGDTAAFHVELKELFSELDRVPATALRKVNFPSETEMPVGSRASKEQLQSAMEKQIMHMRLAIEQSHAFVQQFCQEMDPATATSFISTIHDGPMPNSLAKLFALPLSSLSSVCEEAVKNGTGVICY
jgi:hypothetical protein